MKFFNFVNEIDTNYNWVLNKTYQIDNHQIFILELTSQNWNIGTPKRNQIWKHWLQICKPINYQSLSKTVLLFIDGDKPFDKDWNTPKLEELNQFGLSLCKLSVNEITATISQVPNQLIVDGANGERIETDQMAFTMRQFIETNNSKWLSQLPQTKSVIKAMDAIQEFGKSNQNVGYDVDNFFITGISKRGWITWFIASIDKRVIGFAPLVSPILNIVNSISTHVQAYGNWSFALDDFARHDIPAFLFTKYFNPVLEIIDPINYLPSVKEIPNLLIISTGDEFFLPDSTKSFYNELSNQTRLLILPNINHVGVEIEMVANEVVKFFKLVLNNKCTAADIPYIKWDIVYSNQDNEGTIKLNVIKGDVTSINVWSANTVSSSKRDFRMFTCPKLECYQNIKWLPISIPINSNGQYTYTLSKPISGRSGFYIFK